MDVVRLDVVEVAVRRGEDDGDLLLDRHQVALALPEDRRQALAAGQGLLRRPVQVAPELGEALQLAVLVQVQPERARDLPHGLIWAEPPTLDTELPVSIAGRWPELKRSASR